jgi:proteic killer suppression protein
MLNALTASGLEFILIAVDNGFRYYPCMIRSFRDSDTSRLFDRDPVRKWPPDLQRIALRKLRMLDAAERLADLLVPPGNRLERLRGDRAQQHSIRINDQWRICFRWSRGDAFDVEIVDYHS